METMYDKLGDLLSETLEAGAVQFVRLERAATQKNQAEPEGDAFSGAEETEPVRKENLEKEIPLQHKKQASSRPEKKIRQPFARKNDSATIFNSTSGEASKAKAYEPAKKFIYKKVTPEIAAAYRMLDIQTTCDLEEVKKAYKEKLKYYHPDRYADNPVLEKVATAKTAGIVEAYNLIVRFLSD